MTPSQLRQWSFQNSQPDQWWLCLDGVTEEVPVTVAEIEERLKSGDYSAVQALHISQASMEKAPWVQVVMPPAFTVPAPLLTPPIAPHAELQASGVGTKTKAKPSGKGHDLPLGQIASIILAVSAVGFFLFILRDMPYLMIFLLTWGVMIAVLRKASGVIAFGGGLIVAAIVLLLAATISPPNKSGAGSVSEDDRGEQNELPAILPSNAWYEGGTLASGGATMAEWKRATYENRLASSADFVARSIGGNLGNLDMDDDIKPMAMRLELEISAAYQVGVTDNVPVHEIAAGCITILKAHGQWLR